MLLFGRVLARSLGTLAVPANRATRAPERHHGSHITDQTLGCRTKCLLKMEASDTTNNTYACGQRIHTHPPPTTHRPPHANAHAVF